SMVQSQTAQVSTTPKYVVFDGVTGELLHSKDGSGAVATTQGVLYGLHLGRFADIETRWLYFIVGLVGTAMVGSGLVLWTVKRRSKLPDPEKPYFGFRLVERLNIASIAGLSVAMVAFFWLNRWLPVEMLERAQWEIHGFFLVWLATLVWALVRPAKRAWVELLAMAAGLCFLLPIANMLGLGQGMQSSLAQAGWLFLSFDLSLWLLAIVHAAMAWRVAKHQPPRPRPAVKKRPPVAAPALTTQES
ncbi:PepSY domain-containing protein, partial [Alcaligenaceae bacterium 429]